MFRRARLARGLIVALGACALAAALVAMGAWSAGSRPGGSRAYALDSDPPVLHLELDGVEYGEVGVSGLGSETEIVEYKDTSGATERIVMLPAALKYTVVTVTRPVYGRGLTIWRQQVVNGTVDAAKRNGSFVLRRSTGDDLAVWDFTAAWPSKYELKYNAATNTPVEEVKVVVGSIVRSK